VAVHNFGRRGGEPDGSAFGVFTDGHALPPPSVPWGAAAIFREI
jgi:hypothetical protein